MRRKRWTFDFFYSEDDAKQFIKSHRLRKYSFHKYNDEPSWIVWHNA